MCPCVCHKSTTGPSFPHLKNRINLPHCLSFCPLHCLTAQIFIFKHLHFSPLAHFGRHPQLFIKSVLLKVINPNFQVRLSPCPSQPSLQLTFQSPFGNPFPSPVPHFLVLFADSFSSPPFTSPPFSSPVSSIQYFRPYFVPHNVLGSREMTLGKMDTDLPHPGAFSLSGKTAKGSD